MSNLLPESENYTSAIGHSDEFKRDVYLVINKTTGVVEFETSCLPQLHIIIKQFEEMLGEVLKEPESAKVFDFPGPDSLN